ncbi:MAG: peptidase [Verrucomicrobiota bacterium]
MSTHAPCPALLESLPAYAEQLHALREIVLANTIMCAEIASPTFGEADLVRFVRDRFTESGLQNNSTDEVGNAMAIIPGRSGAQGPHLLVAAHLDNIWQDGIDHSATVGPRFMQGPGVADNSLGVATIISLPFILERLGIELEHNVVLLGAARSMGRGNLEGLRFFVDHTPLPIGSALCVEGVQLGRLSYSCLGMNRGEIVVETPEISGWQSKGSRTAISELNRIISRILAIAIPSEPKTSIILGSMNAGSGFSVPPLRAHLRFEIRSEAPGMVATIREQIEEIVDEANAEERARASLHIFARRKPGSIGFSHPLVRATREIMRTLDITPIIAPSISELSVLLERDIPSLTLGVTYGENKHELNERIEIDPIFRGLAQIAGVLQFMDQDLTHE